MKSAKSKMVPSCKLVLGGLALLFAGAAYAAEEPSVTFIVGNLWLLVATTMVFMMHLGFGALEAGLTQRKNTANILFKNVSVVSLGLLTYALCGFNLMYPGEDFAGGFFGFAGFGVGADEAAVTNAYNPAYTYWTDFIFQGMFAATAATIVSGAVAERIKLESFLLFSALFVGICYPIIGMWKWGGGFLDAMETPFYDFAGSTLVHGVGGWAALACVILLGPRLTKYVNGEIRPIHPHSMPLAFIGVFLLWFGWFGFNGGSVLSADPAGVSLVFVTTALAGAAGAIGAILSAKVFMKRFDLAMALNGALAGLVGITAGADQMAALSACAIGLIAGLIVVPSVLFFDRMKIDDPVGAISVHLVCGIWGTLAVGIFGSLASPAQFMSQLIGVAACGAAAFTSAFALFFAIKMIMGVRVSEEDEQIGLDQSEHGCSAYRGMHTLVEREKSEDKVEYKKAA